MNGKSDIQRVLYAPSDEMQANAIAQYLDDNGVACEVRSYHETAFDGLFEPQKGWGVLRVLEADFERAKALLDKWLTAEPVDGVLAAAQKEPAEDLGQAQPPTAHNDHSSMLKAALLLSLLGNVVLLLFGFDGWLFKADRQAGEIDRRSLESVRNHLVLAEEWSEYRDWFSGEFVGGVAIAEGWAKDSSYGKAILQVRVDRIEVVPTRKALHARINELRRTAGKPWKDPAKLVSALEAGVFAVIDPEELHRLRTTEGDLPEVWQGAVVDGMIRAIEEAHADSLPRRSSRESRRIPPGPRWW